MRTSMDNKKYALKVVTYINYLHLFSMIIYNLYISYMEINFKDV